MGWSTAYKKLNDKYELKQEIKRIRIWADFKRINGDLVLFASSPNLMKDDATVSGTHNSSRDQMLELICRYDFEFEVYKQIELAICKLSKLQLGIFCDFFYNDLSTRQIANKYNLNSINTFFGFVDELVVMVAIYDCNFGNSDNLLYEFTQIKNEFLEEYYSQSNIVLLDFQHFTGVYPELIHPKWNLNSTPAVLSRIRFLFANAVCLRLGVITPLDFEQIINLQERGNYYKKFIFNLLL